MLACEFSTAYLQWSTASRNLASCASKILLRQLQQFVLEPDVAYRRWLYQTWSSCIILEGLLLNLPHPLAILAPSVGRGILAQHCEPWPSSNSTECADCLTPNVVCVCYSGVTVTALSTRPYSAVCYIRNSSWVPYAFNITPWPLHTSVILENISITQNPHITNTDNIVYHNHKNVDVTSEFSTQQEILGKHSKFQIQSCLVSIVSVIRGIPWLGKKLENWINKRFVSFKSCIKGERAITWWNPAAQMPPILDSSSFVSVPTLHHQKPLLHMYERESTL
jgi:hypothetical protein